jgi:nitrogen fixation/metabolism regulation signal transduction histidine kinase
MDDRLLRIEDKIDRLVEVQTLIQLDVAEHIRRTEIAENNIQQIAKEIKPIQEHVAFLRISGKLIAALAALAAVITSIWQLLGGK